MPFREDFEKVFWTLLSGFIISLPVAIITTTSDKIIYIIIYAFVVFILAEIYFIIRWLVFYWKH